MCLLLSSPTENREWIFCRWMKAQARSRLQKMRVRARAQTLHSRNDSSFEGGKPNQYGTKKTPPVGGTLGSQVADKKCAALPLCQS